MISLTKNTARISAIHLLFLFPYILKMLGVMIFGTSEQFFFVFFLVPGETETKNVYSKVCINKTGICCSYVFYLCWSVLWVVYGNEQLFKMINFKIFVLLQCIYVLSFLTRIVIPADVN